MAIRNSQDIVHVLTQPSPHGDIRNSQDIVLLLGQNISFSGQETQLRDFTMVTQPIRHAPRRSHLIPASSFVPVTVTRRFHRHQFFVIT